MLYQLYQAWSDALAPAQAVARASSCTLRSLPFGLAESEPARRLAAGYDVFAETRATHRARPFAIGADEDVVHRTPFCSLRRFRQGDGLSRPRVLLVAPLSGHFATLLRDTVATMVADHDVYVTDWHNARDVPLSDGRFGFDEYVDHVIEALDVIGPGAHLFAVCQPCVPALAAVAIMAEDRHPAQPRTLTLMAGPIDARVSPTKVNELATTVPISWFERNAIATVPARYPGAFRRVYPGFLQLTAFLSMNLPRHAKSHFELYHDLAEGRWDEASRRREFYDEYFAVLDLTAEFYLETVERIFQEHQLAKGTLEHHGRLVDPGAITRTSLLTVEGERDDICGLGQTMAAHDLCRNLNPYLKHHHVQVGVGHYGVFAGRRWEQQVYPIVRDLIAQRE
jgi:poly(3-hydroxybutyrate) depolymerase